MPLFGSTNPTIKINYDDSEVQAGTNRTNQALKGVSTSAVSYAKAIALAYGAQQVAKYVEGAVAFAASISDTAQKLGITNKALQELRYAAGQSGVSVETLEQSVGKFNIKLAEAARGNKTAVEMFKRLGISVYDTNGQLVPLEEALDKVAEVMKKTESATERAKIAQELFGKSGTDMINMLVEGEAAMEALRKKANDLGIVLEDKLIEDAKELDDKFQTLSDVLTTKLTKAIVDLAPTIDAVADVLIVVAENIDWVVTGLTALLTIKAISYVGTLAGSFTALGLSATGAATAVTATQTALGVLGAFIVGWKIGTILAEKFSFIRRAGEYLGWALAVVWSTIKLAALVAWDAIKMAFVAMAKTVLDVFAEMLDTLAKKLLPLTRIEGPLKNTFTNLVGTLSITAYGMREVTLAAQGISASTKQAESDLKSLISMGPAKLPILAPPTEGAPVVKNDGGGGGAGTGAATPKQGKTDDSIKENKIIPFAGIEGDELNNIDEIIAKAAEDAKILTTPFAQLALQLGISEEAILKFVNMFSEQMAFIKDTVQATFSAGVGGAFDEMTDTLIETGDISTITAKKLGQAFQAAAGQAILAKAKEAAINGAWEAAKALGYTALFLATGSPTFSAAAGAAAASSAGWFALAAAAGVAGIGLSRGATGGAGSGGSGGGGGVDRGPRGPRRNKNDDDVEPGTVINITQIVETQYDLSREQRRDLSDDLTQMVIDGTQRGTTKNRTSINVSST